MRNPQHKKEYHWQFRSDCVQNDSKAALGGG